MTKLKRVGYIKEPVLGSTAIFLLKGQENSKLYHLVISYKKPALLCFEWHDGTKPRFLGCINLNLLVFPSEIEKRDNEDDLGTVRDGIRRRDQTAD